MTDYVELDEAAAQLSLDTTDGSEDGPLLRAALDAAQAAINSWCGRSFATDTGTARYFRPDRSNSWVLPVDDFYGTVTVATDTGDNGTYDQAWTLTTDYVLEPINGRQDGIDGWPFERIVAVGSRYFPVSPIASGRRPRVKVTPTNWGWAAVPEPVALATKLKAARLFQRKDAVTGTGGFGASSPSGFSVPLIRITTREDPDVVELLRPYQKVGGSSGIFVAG